MRAACGRRVRSRRRGGGKCGEKGSVGEEVKPVEGRSGNRRGLEGACERETGVMEVRGSECVITGNREMGRAQLGGNRGGQRRAGGVGDATRKAAKARRRNETGKCPGSTGRRAAAAVGKGGRWQR